MQLEFSAPWSQERSDELKEIRKKGCEIWTAGLAIWGSCIYLAWILLEHAKKMLKEEWIARDTTDSAGYQKGKKLIHFGMIQRSYDVMCSMSVCPPQSWCASLYASQYAS